MSHSKGEIIEPHVHNVVKQAISEGRPCINSRFEVYLEYGSAQERKRYKHEFYSRILLPQRHAFAVKGYDALYIYEKILYVIKIRRHMSYIAIKIDLEVGNGIAAYADFYNSERFHQLDCLTQGETFYRESKAVA